MKNLSLRNALSLSLSLHALVFLSFFSFNSLKKEKHLPVAIDLISKKSKNLGKLNQARSKSKSLNTREKVKKTKDSNTDEKISKLKQKKLETLNEKRKEQVAKNQTSLIGESDIELELKGVSPKNERQKYLAYVRGKVALGQFYPRSSRRFKEEGTVKLLLTLEKNGSLFQVKIIKKSQYERLNKAALEAVKKVAPFKEFPESIAFSQWRIKLPIKFSLK